MPCLEATERIIGMSDHDLASAISRIPEHLPYAERRTLALHDLGYHPSVREDYDDGSPIIVWTLRDGTGRRL